MAKKPEDIGLDAYREAEELKKEGKIRIRGQSGEKFLRQALEKYLVAYWTLSDKKVDISAEMHKIGKLLHERYQCLIQFSDSGYTNRCPVVNSHRELGLSIGGTEKHICSICGLDPMDCEHIKGEFYNDIECKDVEGHCNICVEKFGSCEHVIGSKYDDVERIDIVTEIDLDHVSIVERPQNPFCRITNVAIPREEIDRVIQGSTKSEQENFEYGVSPLYCHHCIECDGIRT